MLVGIPGYSEKLIGVKVDKISLLFPDFAVFQESSREDYVFTAKKVI